MSRIVDLGTRVELLSMDRHCHDISVALYRQDGTGGTCFCVYSYSRLEGVPERLEGIVAGMRRLGGLQDGTGESRLSFPCRQAHELALRRVFLDCCKLPDPPLAPLPPLTTVDRQSGLTMTVTAVGGGQYRVGAGQGDPNQARRRLSAIVNGLLRLGDMRRVDAADGTRLDHCLSFACGHDHDRLVALLLQRAPNVRALVREQQATTARGVLAAPSART